MKALVIGLLALLTLTLPAHAAPGTGAKKAFEINHRMVDIRDVRLQPYASLKLRGNFNIRYLLGEPVVGCAALWLNPGVSQVETDGGNRILAEVGEEDLYNLMLVVQFPNPLKGAARHTNGGGAFISVFCDAGIVAQNGKSGFNVSGSPNWDEVMCATPFRVDTSRMDAINRQERDLCKSLRGTWLTREEARKVAAGNIEITDVQVHGFELNNSDTVRRAEKMAWRRTSFARTKVKVARVMDRIYAIGGQNAVMAGNAISAARADVERRVFGSPSATDVKAYDTLLDRALADLEGLRAGEREALQESWQAEDREMIGNQLTRVRGVDETLSKMDSAMARYEADLREAAKDAPQLPDPMKQYAAAEYSYSIGTGDYVQLGFTGYYNHHLIDKSGRRINRSGANVYIQPLQGPSGRLYDVYLESFKDPDLSNRRLRILDANLKPLGKEWYEADAHGSEVFLEDDGLYAMVRRRFYGPHTLTFQIYSFADNRVIIDRILRSGDGLLDSPSSWDRRRSWGALHADVLDGRKMVYVAPEKGNHQNKRLNRACTARTDAGETPGTYPIMMYDVEAGRLLPLSEHRCIPFKDR